MTSLAEQPFDTEVGYLAAIDAVLAATRREVCVFHRDLAGMGLGQVARCDTLGRILAASRDNRLRIVLKGKQKGSHV